jgi:hypothetical protein
MHYVLALPEEHFKKSSSSFQLRLDALCRVRECRGDVVAAAVMLVQLSPHFARRFLASPSQTRLVDVAREVQDSGEELWETQFHYGGVQERKGEILGYQPSHDSRYCGRTKHDVQETMKELAGVGAFYAQHGTILLCGGSAATLSAMHVTSVSDQVCVGGGACRLLHVFAQEDIGFVLATPKLADQDYFRLLLRERKRFRAQGLACMEEADLPFCLRQNNRRWLALPESFGDMLCESAQLLRMLSGKTAPRCKPGSGWEEGAEVSSSSRCLKRPRS